jgi:Uma2 family endonuclease
MRNEALVGNIFDMERSSVRPPSPRFETERDHVVVLRGLSWSHYESLLDARGEQPSPRFAYLDGELEVMTTSAHHERTKKLIARLLEVYAIEAGVLLDGVGNATFRSAAKEAGLEPDECYYIGPEKPSPDFAIEVVHTSGGINKLEIYRRLGVREVWFWISNRFWVYELVGDAYRELRNSKLLPDFDLDEVARIVATCKETMQTPTVAAYQEAVRARLSGGTRPNS